MVRGVMVLGLLCGACVGSTAECAVEDALVDEGDVILLCSSDRVTVAGLRADLQGDAGYVVVAEPIGEPVPGSARIVGPDELSDLHLARITETLTYQITDSLGSDLAGTMEVLAWSGDAYISDERAMPICLEPTPARPSLLQCDRVGQTHATSTAVLFLANGATGLVLVRRGDIRDESVSLPFGAGHSDHAPLESLRL